MYVDIRKRRKKGTEIVMIIRGRGINGYQKDRINHRTTDRMDSFIVLFLWI